MPHGLSNIILPNIINSKLTDMFGLNRGGFNSGFGVKTPRALQKVNSIFPTYLSGDEIACNVPSDPDWHLSVGMYLGDILDCNWPLKGVQPETGYYSSLNCSTEIPT